MSVKLESGQWYRNRDGEIAYCVGPLGYKDVNKFLCHYEPGEVEEYFTSGEIGSNEDSDLDIIEHLPDCTGFDWVYTPKLQLREGAWYERNDGKIVGPCLSYHENGQPDRKWNVSPFWYRDDGTNCYKDSYLIREVEPPQPKYRPFKSAQEFKPFRDKWWRWKSGDFVNPPQKYSDSVCGINGFVFMLESAEFEDGTPFGVLDGV
jgi:hypothetical protein